MGQLWNFRALVLVLVGWYEKGSGSLPWSLREVGMAMMPRVVEIEERRNLLEAAMAMSGCV